MCDSDINVSGNAVYFSTGKCGCKEAGPTGIEPATPGLKVRCSSLTELRTHLLDSADRKTVRGFFSVSVADYEK